MQERGLSKGSDCEDIDAGPALKRDGAMRVLGNVIPAQKRLSVGADVRAPGTREQRKGRACFTSAMRHAGQVPVVVTSPLCQRDAARSPPPPP